MLGEFQQLGRAVLFLETDDAKYNSGIDRAERRLKDVGADFAKAGAIMSATVTGPLALLGKSSLDAFMEQKKANAAIEQGLRTMGSVAGFTSAQLQQMATDMQAATAVADDQILSKVTANLLTFGNISGDVFKRAQQSAVDLSARLGQDLQSSALMLGKALNDPIYGVTALTRVGVSLTEEQKALIKEMAGVGDIAGAQAIILAELEKQYGGQAKAMADATDGVAHAQAEWSDFQERIGEVVALVLPTLTSALRDVIGWLQSLDQDTLKWIVTIGGIVAVVGPVVLAIGGVVAALGALLPVIASVGTAILGLIVATGPIGLFIGAAALLTAAWFKWGDDITLFLTDMFEWIGGMVDRIVGYVVTRFTELTAAITAPWRLATEAAQKMYDMIVGHSIVPDMVMGVEGWLQRLAGSTSASMGDMNSTVAKGYRQQEKGALGTFSGIFGAFGKFSADMLRAHQITSAAQAFISTLAGAAEALKLPFPSNLAAAAQVLATGMGFVSAIKGAGNAGGGSLGRRSSGAASLPPRPAEAPAPSARDQQQPAQVKVVVMTRNRTQDAVVEELAESFTQLGKDGFPLPFTIETA